MKKHEKLLKIAKENDIEIIDEYIEDENLEGLYANNTVLINTIVQENRYNEVLGHELGHHFTLEGNNLLKKVNNDLQEFFADAWSYRNMLSLEKLAKYKYFDYTTDEILEAEEFTEDFLIKAFEYYKNRLENGIIETENYKLTFYPYFKVCKIDEDFIEEF